MKKLESFSHANEPYIGETKRRVSENFDDLVCNITLSYPDDMLPEVVKGDIKRLEEAGLIYRGRCDMGNRLEYIESAKCWGLRNDNAITELVRNANKLDWDEPYNNLKCWGMLVPGDLCVDVGAYIGDSCVPMVREGARVVAIECQPDAFECLKRNIASAETHLATCGCGELVGLHGGEAGNMGARCVVPGNNVSTVPLDSIVGHRKVRLLKIDVEGYEAQVLRGASEVLSHRPIVIIERNDDALENHGSTWDEVLSLLPGYRFEEWGHTEDRLWDYVAWPE
jgi:FkbM family methyltransferase